MGMIRSIHFFDDTIGRSDQSTLLLLSAVQTHCPDVPVTALDTVPGTKHGWEDGPFRSDGHEIRRPNRRGSLHCQVIVVSE